MEFVEYVGSDGFVHYIINNSMGIPFFLYMLLLCVSVGFCLLILKKMLG